MEARQTLPQAAALEIGAANDIPARPLRKAPITPATARYIQERLGRAIRQRRRLMDMTLEDLARYCGVTFQQVHKYESGLCALSASQLWSISVALDVPVSHFYESLAASELLRGPEDPRVPRRD
ncbi:MAG: helix-turn-helix transcriptional regulator [Proteobacteria bacterium]|nr:helix-turn-helix transcriptional regulator [Pseudomonadota bacterium]